MFALGRVHLSEESSEMSGADWEHLRSGLAIAILGFASRDRIGGESLVSAERMLDALSEPDGPLPMLRDLGRAVGPDGTTPASFASRPFSETEIASICLSRRHDFGLLPEFARVAMMAEAREWEQAFATERETIESGRRTADGRSS